MHRLDSDDETPFRPATDRPRISPANSLVSCWDRHFPPFRSENHTPSFAAMMSSSSGSSSQFTRWKLWDWWRKSLTTSVFHSSFGFSENGVFEYADAGPDGVDRSLPTERFYDEAVFLPGPQHPVHAVNARLVVEFDWLPHLSAVLRWDEVEDRAVLDGLAKVPLPSNGDLAFSVAVDIPRRHADVVTLGEVLGDDVLLPFRVLVPLDRFLVGEDEYRSGRRRSHRRVVARSRSRSYRSRPRAI